MPHPFIYPGIETLRLGKAPEWTQAVDDGLKAWLTAYLPWLKNSPLGIGERTLGKYVPSSLTTRNEELNERISISNHGTFYINQEAAIHVILQDKPSAIAALESFFTGEYQSQIDASGEQVSFRYSENRARV